MELNTAITRVGNFQTVAISRNIDSNPKSTDIAIVKHVGTNKRVLELGCACGHMSQALRANGCTVVGIEINPQAAERAAQSCERVIVADLDYMDFAKELGPDRFDVIVAADVLEHLKDPGSVLLTAKEFLSPGGCLVSSIPNIAHLSVRLALLSGRFPYSDGGLLDRTHLRFFTRESAEKLIETAGFAIGHLERIENVPADPSLFEVPYDPHAVPPALLETLSRDPEASTYQFVVVSYPMPRVGLTLIRQRMKDLAREAETAHSEADQLRVQLEQARDRDRLREDLLASTQAAAHDLESVHQSALDRAANAESEVLDLRQNAQTLQAELAMLQDKATHYRELNQHAESLIEALRKQDARSEERLDELSRSGAIANRQAEDLRTTLEEHKKDNAGLSAQVERLLARERDLREMLLDAHDQLMKRDAEIASTLATVLPHSQPSEAASAALAPQTIPGKYLLYQQLLQKIRELVRAEVPQGGSILVISKGDDELLKLEPCKGQHFPQTADGVYAGHYPADGSAAINHLEELRKAGGQFLLIPQPSMWWLDHYNDLKEYLDEHFIRIIDQSDVCVVFDLTRAEPPQIIDAEQRQAETPSTRRPFGTNISGHLTSEKGVGEAVRSQIRSLRSIGVPVELNNVPDDTAFNLDAEFTRFSDENPYSVNLIHLNADSLEYFAEWKRKEYFQGHYNIGYWAWETPVFPRQWWNRFHCLDEIWVGSDFVLDAVSRVSSIPVVKVLLAIPDRFSLPHLPRSHFGLSSETFLFVFIFDFMSIFERKNPLAVVEAFRKAFGKRDNAMLVLKCLHSEREPAQMDALKRACRGLNVKIITDLFTREETTSLMAAADCYVSLHRSEGFGLTMAEAMSLEKPVIATAFSGNMEFMSPSNSYLVKYKLINIDRSYGPYEEGLWADPDADHAAELMRQVFKNRADARDTGRRARADIMRLLGHKRLGTLMRNRLLRIAELGKIAAPEERQLLELPADPSAKDDLYKHLVGRVCNVVNQKIPGDARVIVVSKGDDEILQFHGPRGWHFPQTSDGTYAGCYPPDAAEAVSQVEQLRSKGGQYLLFPQTAFWWLDHYTGLRLHLDTQYHRVWSDPDCIIYKLSQGTQRLRSTSQTKTSGKKSRRALGNR